MKRMVGVVAGAAVIVFWPAAAPAQAPMEQEFGRHLFPPELVMQHQQRISLAPEQRGAITSAIQELQAKVVELQWELQAETQKLAELIQQPSLDETAVLAQLDRVLSRERQIKTAHVALLVRIKNTLTREQQAMLKALREGAPPGGPGVRPPG
ncbi:MAG: periplasmic heavy metal sensor [Gemmatimonadetes bacterium]|nr:periplasmic heavy metal sensor [Gemmatimonadota bacterium]